MKNKGLGRGLGALIPEGIVSVEDRIQSVPLDQIVASPMQPRRQFSDSRLKELTDSIRECGVIQPVLLKPLHTGYQLIAGERRFRAARLAGLERIPAIIRNISDTAALEFTLIENLQREDLNPIEEATGYRFLIDEFGLTQEQVARKIGRERVTITNMLRLLKLPVDIQEMLQSGSISIGHAKVLLSAGSPEKQIAAARQVVARGLSVRALEILVQTDTSSRAGRSQPAPDPNLSAAIDALRSRFGTKVEISRNRKDRGVIRLEFYSEDDLIRILELLNGE